MLQEKAQDRERLLLKFIKIMKVNVAPQNPLPQTLPRSGTPQAAHPAPALTATPPPCSIYGS